MVNFAGAIFTKQSDGWRCAPGQIPVPWYPDVTGGQHGGSAAHPGRDGPLTATSTDTRAEWGTYTRQVFHKLSKRFSVAFLWLGFSENYKSKVIPDIPDTIQRIVWKTIR